MSGNIVRLQRAKTHRNATSRLNDVGEYLTLVEIDKRLAAFQARSPGLAEGN
jgi:hypothetical protein